MLPSEAPTDLSPRLGRQREGCSIQLGTWIPFMARFRFLNSFVAVDLRVFPLPLVSSESDLLSDVANCLLTQVPRAVCPLIGLSILACICVDWPFKLAREKLLQPKSNPFELGSWSWGLCFLWQVLLFLG